jgi:hypothetical protein
MSNKHYALQKLNLSEHLLFLDSDIVCTGYMEQFNQEFQLAAKPVDVSPNFDLEQLVKKPELPQQGKQLSPQLTHVKPCLILTQEFCG